MQVVVSLVCVYLGFALTFVLNGYLTDHLDLEGFGDIQVAFSVAAFVGMILPLGGPAAMGKFIPAYLHDARTALTKGYLHFFFKRTITLGIVAAVLGAGSAILLRWLELEHLEHEAILAIIIAPLLAVALMCTRAAQALHRPIAAILPSEVLRPGLFLLGCMAWLAVFPTFNEYEVIAILFATLAVVAGIQLYFVRNGLPFSWSSTAAEYDKPAWHEVTTSLLFVALANWFLISLTIIAMEILHTDEAAVGVFAILFFVSSLVWTNFNAVMNVIAAKISALTGQTDALQALFSKAFGITFLMNIVIAIPLVYLAEDILAYFHDDVPAYKDWLVIVLVAATVNCALQVAEPFVCLGGHHKKAVKFAASMLVLTLIATPVAVYLHGMEGAIVSLLTLRFIRGLGYLYLLRRHVGLQVFAIA